MLSGIPVGILDPTSKAALLAGTTPPRVCGQGLCCQVLLLQGYGTLGPEKQQAQGPIEGDAPISRTSLWISSAAMSSPEARLLCSSTLASPTIRTWWPSLTMLTPWSHPPRSRSRGFVFPGRSGVQYQGLRSHDAERDLRLLDHGTV